jgi:checkpoint serine/threonine-protein kinase
MSKPLAVKTDNDSPFWVGDTPSSPPAEQSTPSKQLTSPVAVDLATIERHKENIMPLKRGRSAVTDTRHAQLQEQRQAFEKEISKAEELDDPLEPYYRYIKWTVNNYPQGHNHESNLVPLLEQCTRTFHRDPRYQNDPRYLRCWLLYANNVKDPTLIYKFLEANRIGQRLAAYYEEYAAYLEKQGRWRLAKEVYILGIERGAQPLERLRRKYKEFQPRMVAGEEAAQQTSSPAQRVVSRSGITRQPMAVMRDAHAGQRQPLSARGRQSSNTRLEVFSDDDNDLSQEFLIGNATPWSGVDTEWGRHKENRQEPTSWRGQQLPSKIPHRIVPHDKLAVYQDEVGRVIFHVVSHC